MTSTSDTRPKPNRTTPKRPATGRRRSRPALLTAVVAVVAVVALAAIFVSNQSAEPASVDGSGGTDGRFPYVVGEPGVGEQAPAFTLPTTSGESISLDDFRGESVLLYFQEGLMCQPCWDQLKDIERSRDDFAALGVDAIVSITHDPVDALRRKVELEAITSPVLSDRDLGVSRTYDTHKYGMMRETTNGHTFILVGPEAEIRWRADYGGAPKYTMYLPVEVLLADLEAGLDRA